ncbi:hypothetical protein T492DRAFT_1041089 [Pavlovales sp. CCMP2436]|nr:hypothetical protein T492DRAFT_1041089 [Pavlovales sp. CCMP2436]
MSDDAPRWGFQSRMRAPDRHVPEQSLAGGFAAFSAAPYNAPRPMMHPGPGGMATHVQSTASRVQPDLQRKIYPHGPSAAASFAGPDWGIGGSIKLGRKALEPPAALDHVRAQRKHYEVPSSSQARLEYSVEDTLNKKGQVFREGVRCALGRSETFSIEHEVGMKRKV